MNRHAAILVASAFVLTSAVALAQQPAGIISCTSEVIPSTCKAVTTELQIIQVFPIVHSVQFVVADPHSFAEEKKGTADINIAKFAPSATPMTHSSFDDGIIFEVSKGSQLPCPNRIVISTDLFRPVKTEIKNGKRVPALREEGNRVVVEYLEGVDPELLSQYRMFVLGYLEGCWMRPTQA